MVFKEAGTSYIIAVTLALLAAACHGQGPQAPPGPVDPGPLTLKARAYDINHAQWHAGPGFGGRVETVFASPDSEEVVKYEDLGDSTFWTGQYVASQVHRYQVTGSEEARTNAARAVGALHAYMRITGRSGFIGRFAGPVDSAPLWAYAGPCDSENCHVVTEGPYAGNFWLGDTSRDQYTGWFYGMSLYHDLMPDDGLKPMIREDVKLVVDRLSEDQWVIKDVDGLPTGPGPIPVPVMTLMYLATAREMLGPPYDELYEAMAELLEPIEKISAITRPNTFFQYFGISLSYLAMYNLVRLEDDPGRMAIHVETMDDMLYPPVADTHQAFFDLLWMIVTGERPADLMADVKQSLLEFPQAPKRKVHPEHPPKPILPFSLIANDFFDAIGFGDIVPNISPRSIEPYPMRQRCVTGDYWQSSPWALECGPDNPSFEFAGEDYLQAYWLGRYHGFLSEAD